MTNAREIKRLYTEYKEAHEAMLWAYCSEDDAVFDAANEREAEASTALKEAIACFAGLTIEDVNRIMIYKSSELDALIERIAA